MTVTERDDSQRRLGLLGATGIGVGAIVGGGILALAGAAFATTGPGAIVAFALNGAIAVLTALSFSEMASKFPESGGTYTFAKKVLSIEAAFMVGWVVWFASIVAAVLYALGFGYFTLMLLSELVRLATGEASGWLSNAWVLTGLAAVTTVLLAIGLIRRAAGGGQWANAGKVLAFGVLIGGGLWAMSRQAPAETYASLRPFFTGGMSGLLQAMGYSFIALQGFDLIAAVGGEVRRPEKNLPLAMVLSLAIALAIYLPLLLVIATVGVPAGVRIGEAAAENPEGIVALAAQHYLGPFGYGLVIVAAVLSMFSALQANLFAASRIALAMARDATLPRSLSRLHAERQTPVVAVAVTSTIVLLTVLFLSDVSVAGAASSLIFLVTFALAHGVAILVRVRSTRRPPPFRTPLFPVVPLVGGMCCLGLAIYQGIAVPSAGIIVLVWLSLGAMLFVGLLSRRARITDASNKALQPELVTLRGRTPLVLVPIANPRNAESMLALADALVPAEVGRVLLQTVVEAPLEWSPDTDPAPFERSQEVLREVLRASSRLGIRAEALTTVGPRPMEEIARVARLHRCESVLLGLTRLLPEGADPRLEALLGELRADVVVLRAEEHWHPRDARKILVPVAGRGGHEYLLALLLGSLLRTSSREVTFLRVVAEGTSDDDVRKARREVSQMIQDDLRRRCHVEVVSSNDPQTLVVERANQSDLLILGVQRLGKHQKLFGNFTRQLAQRTECALIVMSRR